MQKSVDTKRQKYGPNFETMYSDEQKSKKKKIMAEYYSKNKKMHAHQSIIGALKSENIYFDLDDSEEKLRKLYSELMKIRSRKVNYTSSILHRKQNIASKLGYDISITNETELDNIYSKVQRARLLKLRRNKLKSININTDLMNDKEIWLAYYNDIIIPIFKEKFGEQHPMQSVEGFNQWVTRSYRKKLFTFPSGKTTYIQGCEDIALRELLNVYSESDIVVNKEAMPKIFYMLNGKKRRYFPDIFIPKDNKIFEVKSAYTATLNTDKNAAKQNACKAQGFCFEFMVF